VSDRLQVVSQSGTFDDNLGNGQIDTLDFVIAQSPGADNVDLSEVSVELIGGSGQETFTLSDGGTDGTDIDIFNSANTVVLTDNSDRAEVLIELDSGGSTANNQVGDDAYTLEEGDTLTVTFTTSSGASTTTEIRVPSTVVEDTVRL
jgi:flagellin FlaB